MHIVLYSFMKGKFKQWWSTIPRISTKKTQKKPITSHLKQLNTKRPWYIALEIHVLAWDRHKHMVGLNRGFKVFYNRRYFLNFRRYLKIRLRAIRGPGGGSSWNLAFCGPKNVLQRLQNIKCFWKKNPINFRVQISPRVKTMHNSWIFPPNFLIEYFSLQTSAKIIHR